MMSGARQCHCAHFQLVTLVFTVQRHIIRCNNVAFHVNSNNNGTDVCWRLRKLLHLGKLLKADYWAKSKCFETTWHTLTLLSVPESDQRLVNWQVNTMCLSVTDSLQQTPGWAELSKTEMGEVTMNHVWLLCYIQIVKTHSCKHPQVPFWKKKIKRRKFALTALRYSSPRLVHNGPWFCCSSQMTWLKVPALSQDIVPKLLKLWHALAQLVLFHSERHSHRWGGGSGLWTRLYQDLLFSLAALFVCRGCWRLRPTSWLYVEQQSVRVSERYLRKLVKMTKSFRVAD